MEEDTEALWEDIQSLAAIYEVPILGSDASFGMDTDEGLLCGITRRHAEELARFGGGQLHCTAAFIGGVAAQEIVKIITHQYIPLNNCYIFNGIASCGATFRV